LREVFDVGYAVHRQEEEAKRRKNYKHGYRGNLNTIGDEESEGDMTEPSKAPRAADMATVEQGMRNTNLNAAAAARAPPAKEAKGYGQHSAAVAAAARQQVKARAKGPFELNLDGSTLLRKRQQAGHSNLRESTTVN
jgi:hypothetical protein